MRIGLALKRDAAVGTNQMAGLHQSQQPLYEINKVERNDEQLQHLPCVDSLMLQVSSRKLPSPPHKDEATEVDCCESSKGYEAVDDEHELCQFEFEGFAQRDKGGIEITEVTELLTLIIGSLRLNALFCHSHDEVYLRVL